MIARESIEALRAEHEPCDCADVPHCVFHEGDGELEWPCDTYAALTLALEAETLRTALRRYGVHGPECVSFVPKVIRECKCGLAAALGGTEPVAAHEGEGNE